MTELTAIGEIKRPLQINKKQNSSNTTEKNMCERDKIIELQEKQKQPLLNKNISTSPI